LAAVRLLANENIPAEVVNALRSAGHDVAWVRTESPGATDVVVLRRSVTENRVLITLDKDFGELVFRRGRDASAGVVLFRLPGIPANRLATRVADVIKSRTDWPGHFSVVDPRRIRILPLANPGTKP
jgi:predicted nuclease of predicted toxin-antitoxin system